MSHSFSSRQRRDSEAVVDIKIQLPNPFDTLTYPPLAVPKKFTP
jgi:hypothetical protein